MLRLHMPLESEAPRKVQLAMGALERSLSGVLLHVSNDVARVNANFPAESAKEYRVPAGRLARPNVVDFVSEGHDCLNIRTRKQNENYAMFIF
jgi:hypothetical protein